MKKIKFIKRQDSGFKLSYGNSGETSLNLSNDIFDFISQGKLSIGEESDIIFRIYKEDCIKAMSFIIMKLPLYKSSSNYSNKVDNYIETFGDLYSKTETFFKSNEFADYKVSLFYRPDGRIYLKGLRVNGFSIRDYLVENYSALQFDNEGGRVLNLRILSNIEDNGNDIDEEILELEKISLIPLQQIFYGAPGTGKSHEVKRITKGESVIRTTFHPDSDYSTFVGAYKPTMKPVADKYKAVAGRDEEITYEFVPQSFLQAYINAWRYFAEAGLTSVQSTPKKQFLVIEEINRGNCAQIFGDLFQLLDRDDAGFSEYPIQADSDMKKHLAAAFKDLPYLKTPALGDMTAEETALAIRNGEKLILPNNLYIFATMNTSDQSLFPIDSAFKRRWDWQYVPIHDGGKGWMIVADGKRYDWWQFVGAMNNKIGEATYSEDKKLGYFFCKPKDKIIDAEIFVGKVIFYIWNDIFKDFAEESGSLFKDEDGSMLSFNKFYAIGSDGSRNVVESKISILMQNLGVEPIGTYDNIEVDENGNGTNDSSGNRSFDYTKYSVNGEGAFPKGVVAQQAIKKFVEMNPTMTADEVVRIWLGLNIKVPNLIETEQMYNTRTTGSYDGAIASRYKIVAMSNGEKLYVSNQYNVERINNLIEKVNAQPWGIRITKVEE